MPGIYPSLIAADMMNLQKEIEETEQYVHGYILILLIPILPLILRSARCLLTPFRASPQNNYGFI